VNSIADYVPGQRRRAIVMVMGAQSHERARKQRGGAKGGRVFELPAGARVVRRGSTQVEARRPDEHARPGRGYSLQDPDSGEG
jgi:hypothetical protein